MNFNPPAVLLIVSSFISLMLAVYVWQRLHLNTRKSLASMLLAATIWSLFYGLELAVVNYSLMSWFNVVAYLGISTLPVLWAIFAARYSGFDGWLTPKNLRWMFLPPAFTFLFVLTNDWHHLYYSQIEHTFNQYVSFRRLTSGPLWYFHILVSYFWMITGFVLLIKLYRQVSGDNRTRILIILIGAVFPYLVNVAYVSGFRPWGFLDVTPIGFIIMGAMLTMGVFRARLFEITPVAKDILFSSIPDPIFVLNNHQLIINVNPPANDLLENIFAKDAQKTKGLTKFPDQYFSDSKNNKDIDIGGKSYQYNYSTVRSKQGREIGSMIILHDITGRKTAESKLRNLSGLQNLLMKMATEYINLDLGDIGKTINASLAQLGSFVNADRAYIFDYDWENQTCSNTYEWCYENITPEIEHLQQVPLSDIPEWVNTHQNNKPLYIADVSGLPDDDNVKKILQPQGIKSLITIPIMDKNHCIGFIGFDSVRSHHQYQDEEKSLLIVFAQILVNLRKKSQLEKNLILEKEKANAANTAKSEFLANISHEIRTPMNSILGFSEVMLNNTQNEQQKSYLKTILNSGRSLLSLINDILDLSKIEAGQIELMPEPIDIRVVLSEVKSLFQQKSEEKGIDLLTEVQDDFPRAILIDEIRIRQILVNIVGNAVKFTHKGFVKIIVENSSHSKDVIDFSISVTDSGIGISPEEQSRVFDNFHQSQKTNIKQYEGTGLGLSISKRLIELMQGSISLDSEPGKGSVFFLNFQKVKIADAPAKLSDEFLWNDESHDFRGSTVLVVDDVSHNRKLVSAYLEGMNLKVLEVENGQLAIDFAIKYLPDIIFMDIRMPGINGYEATKVLKNNDAVKNIPVIALTASTMKSDKEHIAQIFDGYLRKPVQKKSLIQQMTRFLNFVSSEKNNVHKVPNKDLDENAKENINQILNDDAKTVFTKDILPLLEKQTEFIILDDLNELYEKLDHFARQNDINPLQKLNQDLSIFMEDFDLDKIQTTLKNVQDLFKD